MQQVNVFIETSSRFRGNVERKCGYVLSTQLRTGKETREHFGRVTGTYHQAILLTMVDALDHMTRRLGISEDKPCVWFLAKECCNKNIAIHSYMTGEKIPDDLELNYLGSYMLNSQILIHVFSEIK